MARRKPRSTPKTPAELASTVLESAIPPTAEPTPEVDEVTELSNGPAEEDKPKKVGESNLAQTIRKHRHRYVPAIHPQSGKKTANNGDDVARILLVTPLTELRRFTYNAFAKDYTERNPGHERMCCGNLVRNAYKKGDENVTEWLNDRAVAAGIPKIGELGMMQTEEDEEAEA